MVALACQQVGEHSVRAPEPYQGIRLQRKRKPWYRRGKFVPDIDRIEAEKPPAPFASFDAIEKPRMAREVYLDAGQRRGYIDDCAQAGDRAIARETHQDRAKAMLSQHVSARHVDRARDKIVAAAGKPAEPYARVGMEAISHLIP